MTESRKKSLKGKGVKYNSVIGTAWKKVGQQGQEAERKVGGRIDTDVWQEPQQGMDTRKEAKYKKKT